jgi:predicted Zn finger-like uncharacterized protein
MYTQCPECLTIFRVGAADLGVARGHVRCAHCNALFDALRNLADELPEEPIHRLSAHPTLPLPPQLGQPVFRPNPAQASLPFDPGERPRGARTASPAFARRRRRAARPARNGAWIAASALLLLVLFGQVGWAERARWLDDGTVRPWLERACATLGCRLPLRHDVDSLSLASREIRPHPTVEGALVIAATVRNDASFAQAWPVIGITLSDLDEKRIAMRRFLPREYLLDTNEVAAGIAPGASAALVFEVVDPGRNAVAFEFKFE